MIEALGLIGTIVLPLSNVPLILRIEQRKSSKDISLPWVWGVWGCLVLMLPAGLASPDLIFKLFAVLNLTLFSGVLIQVLRYR